MPGVRRLTSANCFSSLFFAHFLEQSPELVAWEALR